MGAEPAGRPVAHPDVRVRRLTPADAPLYRPLRLEALRLHPEAFAGDFVEESRLSTEAFAARNPSPPSGLFGAFREERLVGMAGLIVSSRAKLRHKGLLVGLYVAAPFRRAGVGRALAARVLAEARAADLRVVQLGVTATNEAARRLYVQFGFRCYGVEVDALCVDGVFHDDALMALWLS